MASARSAEEDRLVARVGRRLGVDHAALARLGPVERAQTLIELRELEAAFKDNPLLGYRPHVVQQPFHAAIGLRLRAFFGGNRSGKTTAAVLDALIQTVDRDVVPAHLAAFKRFDPPFYHRVVTQDLSNTMEGVIHQKVREWCPPAQLRGGNFDRAYDKALRVLHFRNGSWWQFNSNDQDLNKLGGAALHRVTYDEEPRRDVRGECIVRLIDFGGDEVFAMTPLLGLSFTFEEIYEPWVRGEIPKGCVLISSVWDNPHLSHEEIAVRLAGFSAEERQAREGGRFVAFEGLVYSEWSPGVHIIPELAALPAGEVFTGIDPGIRHMCGVLYVLVEPSGRMIVFDEIPSQGETIATVCKRMHARKVKWACEPRWNVIDPASRNKNNQTGRSDALEFSDGGIVTIPGQNSVSAGIQRIKARLAPTDQELNVGPPMLLVTANCRELVKEFSRYRWSKPKRVEGESRDAPVKADDHLLDALRYVAMSRPLAPPQAKWRNQTTEDRWRRAMLAEQGLGTLPQHPCGSGIFD